MKCTHVVWFPSHNELNFCLEKRFLRTYKKSKYFIFRLNEYRESTHKNFKFAHKIYNFLNVLPLRLMKQSNRNQHWFVSILNIFRRQKKEKFLHPKSINLNQTHWLKWLFFTQIHTRNTHTKTKTIKVLIRFGRLSVWKNSCMIN